MSIVLDPQNAYTGLIVLLEELDVFYRGLILGVMISAPVGPIGVLCIRRTIRRGLVMGLATGLGAALADTIFGIIAAFSVSAIVEFLHHYSPIIRTGGGLFLLGMAWRTWHDKPHEPPKTKEDCNEAPTNKVRGLASHIVGSVASSFALTLTNPVTMFATLAVIATFGELHRNAEAATIVSGIFCGAAAWWAFLSGGVALVRGHFTESRIVVMNKATAVALSLLALWAGGSGIMMFLKHHR